MRYLLGLTYSALFFVIGLSSAFALDQATICRFPSMQSALSYLAEKWGFFEKEGVKITFHDVLNPKLCQDAVVTGRADFFVVGTGALAYLGPLDHPIKIVANLNECHGIIALARKDRGISTFADFKGKRIGYLPGTLSANLIYHLMESNGWARNDLKLTALQPPAMVQAIRGGQIDAFALWEPWISNATVSLDSEVVRLPAKSLRYQGLLGVHREFLKDHRSSVLKVVRAFIRTERHLRESREEATTLLVPFLKMDRAIIAALWDDYQARVNFPETVVPFLEEQFRLIRKYEADFSDAVVPNFEKSLDRSVMAEIDREGWRASPVGPAF